MKKTILTVATLGIALGTAAFAAGPNASSVRVSDVRSAVVQDQSKDQAKISTFLGTISKDGDQFILKEDSSKATYQLDDQQSAGKFAGKKVRVTGVLDASTNTIRVQTIEVATA
jgi:hypothetical protein